MVIETTVLDFKLSNTFEEYKAHMNAPEQQEMFKKNYPVYILPKLTYQMIIN